MKKRILQQPWMQTITSFVLLVSCSINHAIAEDKTVDSVEVEQRLQAVEKQVLEGQTSTPTRKDYYMNREFAINKVLLQQAKDARAHGDYALAESLYGRVLGFAPKNQYAIAGLAATKREKKQNKQLKEAQKLLNNHQLTQAKVLVHDVLLENPQHALANTLNVQISEKLGDSNATLPQLKSKFNKPVTLEFRNANIKMVFDALSRDTGINFILDKDIRADMRANINVRDVSIEEAIDTVIASNGLEKKVINENTVIIFPRNAIKLKAYQELLIRNFYLNNTKAKDVAELLKSMIKTKDIFVYERLNMLVVRDRPEVIHLAEKLVASMDLADPEVMLEIEVLEVSRSRMQDLGVIFPSQLSVLGADTGLTLEALKAVNSSTIGVSANPSVNFQKNEGDLNLLSNPRIRVKNNDTAQISVGDKVPVITTTSTANVGVSENVTYVDVGLKLEVEPHITLDDFVDINVNLEVSTLGDKTVTTNGAVVYTIGNRTAQTSLRLKDGETQILAGLILDDDRRNISKLPGLGDIPLLGRIFSNNDDSNSKTEIVLAITPRVLGNIPLPNAQFTEYWSGTATHITDKIKKSTAVNGSAPNGNQKPTGAFGRLMEQRRQRANQLQTTPVDPALVPVNPVNLLPKGTSNLGQPNDRYNKQQTESTATQPEKPPKPFIPPVEFLK